MADVFISYARSTEAAAERIAEALRAAGHGVWRDDELPAHRSYSEVIEERLRAAKAVVVVWSAEAVRSEWVQSEADHGRQARKLVQLSIDGATLPMPFDRIQCADLTGWTGDLDAPGWKKVAASVAELLGKTPNQNEGVAAPALPLPDKPSIAVMPLANFSGDDDQQYFADGMLEEITSALSRFKSIFVIGSGSTLRFRGSDASRAEIGMRLGVRYLLEGNVRKHDDRVRIGLKLTEAAHGAQLWADRFEDTLDDIFALQDKVALAVAGIIEPAIRSAEIERASRKPVSNLQCYDLYLRALPLIWPPARERLTRARELLERAIERDATFAAALAQLSLCYGFLVVFNWSDEAEGAFRRRALELGRRAVRAAPDDPAVLTWAGNTLMLVGSDWREGGVFIERAVGLNPGDAAARFIHGRLELMRGEPDRAVADLEVARRLDPLSERIQAGSGMLMGVARFYQGRFAEAVTLLSDADAEIGSPAALSFLTAALGQLGEGKKAAQTLARLRERVGSVTSPMIAGGRPEHWRMFEDGIAAAAASAARP